MQVYLEVVFNPQLHICLPANVPRLAWASAQSRLSGQLPNLEIAFADGTKDLIRMEHYNPTGTSERMVERCLFVGRLVKDASGVAAVTGCPDGDDVQVTLLTSSLKGMYRMLPGNQVSAVNSSLSSIKRTNWV